MPLSTYFQKTIVSYFNEEFLLIKLPSNSLFVFVRFFHERKIFQSDVHPQTQTNEKVYLRNYTKTKNKMRTGLQPIRLLDKTNFLWWILHGADEENFSNRQIHHNFALLIENGLRLVTVLELINCCVVNPSKTRENPEVKKKKQDNRHIAPL